MKKTLFLVSILLSLFFLPGCWNKTELDEWGFAMAAALDQGENGNIDFSFQMYRPKGAKTGGNGGGGEQTSNFIIKTSDVTLFEAVRDVSLHLGRKTNKSHMRIILIGEKLAKTADVGKIVDFFYRDHEPRHTISIMIAKGRADKMLDNEPIIEDTTGQQLLLIKQFSNRYSAKTLDTNLLDLAIQMNSPHSDAAIAYVYKDKRAENLFNAGGVALLKKGKMISVLPSKKTEGLIMLLDKYNSGVVNIACPGKPKEQESLELLSLKTKMKPKMNGDKVSVQVKTKADGAIVELKCTEIKTRKDEEEFIAKMEDAIKKEMEETIKFLQAKKTDVLGIGNQIYSMDPNKWEKMKHTWDAKFAEIPFDIKVKLRLVTTGTVVGKTSVTGESE
ncbi:Ger(x)C family spore germination protein [Paenibacillus tarimensis]